jgi:processive 1,2-diacylglycerol beta-glucosyltransferase
MSKLRILVLTSSTGGGHDARAEAFAEWCFQLYRHEVDVRIEHMLEKSSVVNRTGVNLYNRIQRLAPWVHRGFYAAIELLSWLNRSDVTFGAGFYLKVLKDYQPHLVFSVHDCLNRGYFQLARKVLGGDRVRCATYCGEFSGGWGYSRNWIEPSVDLYFSRTPTARDYAVKQGIDPAKAPVRGYLMQPRAHLEVLSPVDRRVFQAKRFGLNPDKFTVFLATGGNGAIYYGLAVGGAEVDAGGIHEALVGAGYCLGPALGLASFSAGAGEPVFIGLVLGVLAVGFVVAVVRAGRARSQSIA